MALSSDQAASFTTIINDILRDADLDSVSAKQVRQQLESKLQTDLTPQKQAVNDLIVKLFDNAQGAPVAIKGAPAHLESDDLLFRKLMGDQVAPNAPCADSETTAFVAKSSSGSSNLFNLLPQEILSLVVGHVVEETLTYWRCKVDFPKLKALRLSCRRLAYNHRLLEILFHGIRLIVAPSHINLLEQTDISKIATYVHRLTFFPPSCSWSLEFDGFKEIVISQAIQRYAHDENLWTGYGSFAMEEDGYTKFIEQYWKKPPFSDQELADGHKRYMNDAAVGRNLFGSQRLKDLWIKALRSLPNCKQFRIDSQEYNGRATDIPKNPGCEIYKHHHDRNHSEGICRQSSGVLGDKVFELAVQCLSQAQVQPTALDLKFRSLGQFGWTSLPGWDQLDLSKLEKLRFQPMAQCLDEWNSWDMSQEVKVSGRACEALDAVLRKCSNSITDLLVKRDSPLTWPGDEIIPLPELRHIELSSITVNNAEFARLLPLLTKLEDYALWGTNWRGEWKVLFDAIRNHPNRLNLRWDQVPANDAAEVSAYFNTADASENDKDDDAWGDIDRSLQNYLAGKGRWNKSLRMWFENASEDETDTSDEDEAIQSLDIRWG